MPVFIDNDANAALAEKLKGCGRKHHTLCVTIDCIGAELSSIKLYSRRLAEQVIGRRQSRKTNSGGFAVTAVV